MSWVCFIRSMRIYLNHSLNKAKFTNKHYFFPDVRALFKRLQLRNLFVKPLANYCIARILRKPLGAGLGVEPFRGPGLGS